MRATRILMGMPITIDVVGATDDGTIIEAAFAYFEEVDRRFSTYRNDSEIAAINRGCLAEAADCSDEMREVLALAERDEAWRRTASSTFGKPDGSLDPSGIVKGWAIRNAAALVAPTRRPRFLHRRRRRHSVIGQECRGHGVERRHPQSVQ